MFGGQIYYTIVVLFMRYICSLKYIIVRVVP